MQVTRNKPTGTCASHILHLAKLLFRVLSSPKSSEFVFEHCWQLVKDFLRCADEWFAMRRVTPSKRRASPTFFDRGSPSMEAGSAIAGNGEDRNPILRERPSRSRAVKAIHKAAKAREEAAYRQAEATQALAEAMVAENAILADRNLIMLMTAPVSQISGAALRFIRMRQEEELAKYEAAREATRLQKEVDRVEREAQAARQAAVDLEEEKWRAAAERADIDRQLREAAAAF